MRILHRTNLHQLIFHSYDTENNSLPCNRRNRLKDTIQADSQKLRKMHDVQTELEPVVYPSIHATSAVWINTVVIIFTVINGKTVQRFMLMNLNARLHVTCKITNNSISSFMMSLYRYKVFVLTINVPIMCKSIVLWYQSTWFQTSIKINELGLSVCIRGKDLFKYRYCLLDVMTNIHCQCLNSLKSTQIKVLEHHIRKLADVSQSCLCW